jgi:hypothetical protein
MVYVRAMVMGREKIATGCGSTGRNLSRKWVILSLSLSLSLYCNYVWIICDLPTL